MESNYSEEILTINENRKSITNDFNMIKIGDTAPIFNANSTIGPIKLTDYLGKWVILFSHPGDFTPVCTTEFIALARMNNEFEARNCNLIGISVDSNASHLAWIHDIHRNTGVQIPFPLIEDLNMKISNKYGMVSPKVSDSKTIRNVFFINPEQKVCAILQYPIEIGRNTNEILRILDALQESEKNNIMTPANWMPGQPCLNPAPKTYTEMLSNLKNSNQYNCLDWYLCFNVNNNVQPNIEENKIMPNTTSNFIPYISNNANCPNINL